jgi:phosphatidylethanolamine N-methyltransferase
MANVFLTFSLLAAPFSSHLRPFSAHSPPPHVFHCYIDQHERPRIGFIPFGCANTVFKVPTTHDVLTLFNPAYPKSHFDILSLFLLGSQLVVFFTFVYKNRQRPDILTLSPDSNNWTISIQSIQPPRSPLKYWAQAFFLAYFTFWRLAYNLGLGIVLTKQSKKRWIVRYVQQQGWLDSTRRPKVRDWIKRQLSGKMGKDYGFDGLPVEYNAWLLFRQVVDIILLNDFLSYVLFALCHLNIFFPSPPTSAGATVFGSFVSQSFRLIGGIVLLLFNLWVKTSAHDVVKDYGWYWGDCFFSRGYIRSTPSPTADASQGDSMASQQSQQKTADLQFDLVFDGIFEMAPHPMYSVG